MDHFKTSAPTLKRTALGVDYQSSPMTESGVHHRRRARLTSQGGFNMPNPVCEQKILVSNDVGSILAGGTDIPPDTTGKGGIGNTGLDWANEYNFMQSYAIQHSRLHIPVVFGVDAVIRHRPVSPRVS